MAMTDELENMAKALVKAGKAEGLKVVVILENPIDRPKSKAVGPDDMGPKEFGELLLSWCDVFDPDALPFPDGRS